MNEGIATQLVCRPDQKIATGYEITAYHQIRDRTDLREVFVYLTGNTQNVRTILLDLTKCLRRSVHRLVNDDSFHIRILGQVHDGLHRRVELFGKVVRIDGQRHPVLPVFLLKSLRPPPVVLRLRDRAGDDTDVKVIGCVRTLFV